MKHRMLPKEFSLEANCNDLFLLLQNARGWMTFAILYVVLDDTILKVNLLNVMLCVLHV